MVDITMSVEAGRPPGVGPSTRRKTGGRKKGTPNHLSRQSLLDLQLAGGDPPHLALLKIGRNEQHPIAIRVSALGFAAPYFQARPTASTRVEVPFELRE
jgi:hypothetical protein